MTKPKLIERYPRVADLYQTLDVELQKHDTHHAVFHGATDWHSAVHAHWARLWLAQQLNDRPTIEALVQRLTGPNIHHEFNTLVEDPAFERPYGRAWLLRLGVLLERISGRTKLRASFETCATDLLEHLMGTRDPNLGEYANPCWTVLQLAHWYKHTQNNAQIKRCNSWVQDIRTACTAQPEADESAPEFFSRWALQCMVIAEFLGPEALQVHIQGLRPEHIRPIHPLRSIHHLGINASRAWGLATLYQNTGHTPWRNTYEEHLDASFALHEKWCHDPYAYGHWVPQFTIYALYSNRENHVETSVS